MSTKHVKSSMLFRSKADTLRCLQKYESLAIPDFLSYTFVEWQSDPLQILEDCAAFSVHRVVVRSSCLREDSEASSCAGVFTSLLNITPSQPENLREAIDTVFASYGQPSSDDQVIIQHMLEEVYASGVIMTRVPSDGSPYYVINYDDISGKTDAITGGSATGKTAYVLKNARMFDFDSERLHSYVVFSRNVEDICGNDALDIEFCQDSQGIIHLLQVRPLCTQAHWIKNADEHIRSSIKFINDFIKMRMRPTPSLYGSYTILGVMPDWNPAEMIGITPRNLASSLYRELITKESWRTARAIMGYRALPPTELMVLIGGRPFIDVRASFNSFLPQGIDEDSGEKLVNAWLDRLDKYPELHDKVEFEIAQTIYDFCFDEHFTERYGDLLSPEKRQQYKEQLQQLTLHCLDLGPKGSLDQAFKAIEELKKRQILQQNRKEMALHSIERNVVPEIAILLDECRHYGTIPFSVIARHAFIAETLLKTAVKRGALEASRLAVFKTSIETVAGEMTRAFMAVCNGNLSEEAFIQEYGHLRPGSYDILSPRYADREGLFTKNTQARHQELEPFDFTEPEKQAFNQLFVEAGLGKICIKQFERYARLAIAGRENTKFVFTRHLSDALESLAFWGEGMGLSREDLSFLDIQDCLKGVSQTVLRDPRNLFKALSDKGKHLFDLTRSLKLSYLIRSERDVHVVPQHRSAPNFVGNTKAEGTIVYLSADSSYDIALDMCIVCIENADPGFDWIFTRNIAGLITMFGGMNSHMAIRCAEYALPAAIGVGERLFEKVAESKHCILDAETCTITME